MTEFNKGEFDKEQEERREYVKNIGIEYRFGCYEEKRADSCHILAEYLEAVDQTFSKAYTLLKENCELRKYPKSCYKYATYRISGRECEASFKEAIRPLEIACDGNVAMGCRYLGLIHWNGEPDREPDSKKAEKYMQRACELEDSEACWLLSTWYIGASEKFALAKKKTELKKVEQHRMGQLEKNMELALKYAKLACDLNVPYSCVNVARMYKIGDGIPKDPDLAKEYLDKGKAIIDLITKVDGKNVGTGFTG